MSGISDVIMFSIMCDKQYKIDANKTKCPQSVQWQQTGEPSSNLRAELPELQKYTLMIKMKII